MSAAFLRAPVVALALLAGCASAPDRAPEVPRSLLGRAGTAPAVEPATPARLAPPQTQPLRLQLAPPPLQLDPAAEAFVARALQRSPDLAAVTARFREAAGLAQAAGAAQRPRVTGSAQVSGGTRRQTETGAEAGTEAGAGTAAPAALRQRVSTLDAGLAFSWELDLFGRLASARRAAGLDHQAAAADLAAARVTIANALRAEIVRLRAADAAVVVAEGILDDLRQTLATESAARAAGLRSDVDLGQLRSAIGAREAELIALRIEARSAPFRLRTLSDLPLEDVAALRLAGPVDCALAPPDAVPLAWLQARHDVAAAELRVGARAAAARSAHAALYPSVSLTGALTRQRERSVDALRVVTQTWQRSVGLDLVGTLFDAGQRAAEAGAADARTEAAVAEFKRTLLLAAEEVDGAIARVQVLTEAESAAATAAREAALGQARVERRHAEGIDSRLALLQARREAGERSLLALAFARDRCVASLDLNRALGLKDGP